MDDSIFDELNLVQDIVAYDTKDDAFTALTQSINNNHVFLDLSKSHELRSLFLKHYNVKSLPVLITDGSNIYNAAELDMHVRKKIESCIDVDRNTVFIKGTLAEPKCGYTRQLTEILREMGADDVFQFDILSDERVRQKLKEVNRWPTFPQVYLRGKFCGGLDVLRKMVKKQIAK